MNLQECFLWLAKCEEDGCTMYYKFSQICSEKLKQVVISFSKEEEKHKIIMLELSDNEKFKEKELDNDVENIFNMQIGSISNNDIKLNEISEKEFFIFALQLEKNSIEIYTKLLYIFEMDDYMYKKIENLIKEERKHMVYILNKLYELK